MAHKTIYCEMDYWREISKILSQAVSPLDENFERVMFASKMVKAFRNASSIHFEDPKLFNKFKKEQQLLARLVDRSENVKGYPDINCDDYQTLPNISVNSLNSIFLSESHKQDAVNKGVMALDSYRSSSDINLYKDFGISIKKYQQISWSEILEHAKHNCNAMLMFDLYILKDKENNLYKILNSLLPLSLDGQISYDLTIFTLESNNLKNEHQNILKKIKEIRPCLDVNLSIFRCGKNDFHDRAIITNYIWIGCGGGFDLLKKDIRHIHDESVKTTTIPMLYPALQDSTDWGSTAYENFIDDAKKIRKCNQHTGSGHNRLLV